MVDDLAARGELIRKALEARPTAEDAWTALLNALHNALQLSHDDATKIDCAILPLSARATQA